MFHLLIALSDVRSATVATDLLVYPKHALLMCIHEMYINTAHARTHTRQGPERIGNSWAWLAKGSVIKPHAGRKLEVHVLRAAVVERYEEQSAHRNQLRT